jgi:hypothetical protein
MRTSKPRYTVVIVDGDSFVLDGETGEYVAHFGRKEEGARDWADNMSRIDAAKRSGARARARLLSATARRPGRVCDRLLDALALTLRGGPHRDRRLAFFCSLSSAPGRRLDSRCTCGA